MFIIDDIFQAIGARNAANAQERSAGRAMDLQREQFNQTRADQMPWLQAGQSSLADLLRQMQAGRFDPNVDPQSIASDPGFQFRMAEGQKALERSAAARGGLGSGAAMKSLQRFSQGLASDEYQNAWNRSQMDASNRFGRLAQMASFGQNAAQSLGNFGGQYANSMSSLYGAQGNAQAAGHMAVANGIGGAIRSAGNLGMLAAGGGFAGMGGLGMQDTGWTGNHIPTQVPLQGNPGKNRIGGY